MKARTKHFLLASSGGVSNKSVASKEIDKLKCDKSEMEITKSPLAGVNIDIEHFFEMKKIQGYEPLVVETSKYMNLLITKQKILELFQQYVNQLYFNPDEHAVSFFFTGHGYYEGAMCIQTQDNPDGEPLYLHQIFDIWNQKHKEVWFLHVTLDCCYAGQMALKLKSNRYTTGTNQAVIHCSSGPYHTSLDLNVYGGLLICLNWSYQTKRLSEQEKEELKKKFESKMPVCLHGQYSNWSELTPIPGTYK